MENQEIEVITQDKGDTALYLLTKAEIDSSIATAKAFPRSIKKFMDKTLSIATISENVAASCTYALPRAGGSLSGPSIRLAEIVASSYTNIRYGGRVIANDGKMITAQGICIDLENNTNCTVEVSRKITDKTGKTFTLDMQVVTGNAAIAIAIRNAIFKVIPSALIGEIYEHIQTVARGTAETLVVRRNKAVDYFRGLKVTDKQICAALEIQKIEDIDLDKLFILTGFKESIRNGDGTVESIFNPNPEKAKAADNVTQAEKDLAEKIKNMGDKTKV
jgi:hypothetical protein